MGKVKPSNVDFDGGRAEPDQNTRYNMARFLGINLGKFLENRPILQDLLRTEQSKRIRRRVAIRSPRPGRRRSKTET